MAKAKPKESLREGALINGQFRLKRQIGSGGMSAVWAAEHLRLSGLVAIKFLGREYRRDSEAKLRFVHEAQSASRIRSPHVVQVLDQGTTSDGIPFLVMELLEGEDLAQRLDRIGASSLHEVAVIVEQIGRALAKAHREGLVHRDIKPHNVFLVADGSDKLFVKLLDFGIAKDVTYDEKRVTLAGSMLGSAHYMSPEQLSDPQSVGPETDIWALGVVVYEMLSGRVPFDGRSLPDVLLAVRAAKFPSIVQLRPDLPVEIDDWLRKAMNPDPKLRFESVDQMWRAFSTLVWGQVDETPTAPAPPFPPLPTATPLDLASTLTTRTTMSEPEALSLSFARTRGLPRWTPLAVALCAVACFVVFVVLNLRRERPTRAANTTTTTATHASTATPVTSEPEPASEVAPAEPPTSASAPVVRQQRPVQPRKAVVAPKPAESATAPKKAEQVAPVKPVEPAAPTTKYRGF